MTRQAGAPAIAVLGHYGNSNLGDEAIIHAVVAEIRRRWPTAPLYAVSNTPIDTAWRHRVPAVSIHTGALEQPPADSHGFTPEQKSPWRPETARKVPPGGLWRVPAMRAARRLAGRILRGSAWTLSEVAHCWHVFRFVRRLDLLLIAGSNQMTDYFGGPSEFPYLNFRWSVLARLAGCRIAWVSVGAGPLDARLSRCFLKASLRLAAYVSTRDGNSQTFLRGIGITRPVRVFPDLAHGLSHPSGLATARPRTGDRRRIVGINPMPIYDGTYWPEDAPVRYTGYIKEMAAFATALRSEGYSIFFFGTHPRDISVAHDIQICMKREHGEPSQETVPLKTSATIEELLDVLASADLIVATRFHGVLLSLLVNRPVFAICYYRKTRDLMLDFGQGDEFAVALEKFRAGDAITRIRLLEARAHELTATMTQKKAECRAALAQQYDLVFDLVTRR